MSKKDKLISSINNNPDLQKKLKNTIFNLLSQVSWIERTSKEFKPIVDKTFTISVDIDKFMFDFLGETNYSVTEIYNMGEDGLVKLLNEYAQSKKDLYDSITFVIKSNQDSFKWKGSPEQLNKLYEALKGTYIDSQTYYKDFSKVFSGEPIKSHNRVIWLTSKADLLKLFELLNGKFIKYENDYLILNLLFWHKIKGKKLMPLKQANQDMRGRSKDNKNTLKLTEIVKSLSL